MASSFFQAPASLQFQESKPRNAQSSAVIDQTSSYPASAFTLLQNQSEAPDTSTPPPVEHVETPSGSNPTLSHHQSSDFGDLDDDPFFGADFNSIDPSSTPSFLDKAAWEQTAFPSTNVSISESQNQFVDISSYPLTPAHTVSAPTTSPRSERRDLCVIGGSDTLPKSVSPQQLQKAWKPTPVVMDAVAFITPSRSNSNRTSEDGLAPAFVPIHPQSPIVTVSVWDKDDKDDDDAPRCTVEPSFEENPSTACGGYHHSAGDIISTAHDDALISGNCDASGQWQCELGSRRGLNPRDRPSDEVPSINETASKRATEERNQIVGRWLSHKLDDVSAPLERSVDELQATENSREDDNNIPLGHHTENRHVPGQTYFEGAGGEMSDVDLEIIASGRNWADAPMLPGIQMGEQARFQPESSQAAIAKFENMCRDNDSIISRSATWGTRRRSFPSVIDAEGVTSGNFLKKLSLSRTNGEKIIRRGSFLKDLRGLVRRTSVSQLRKRSRSRSRGRSVSGQEEASYQGDAGQSIKRERAPHLSSPMESLSSGRKPSTIFNTALASMGQNIASMWTGHSRSGSVSGVSPASSPRASLSNLTVKNSLRRPRSKSELAKPSISVMGTESTSSLIDRWRKTGGPPVPLVSRVDNSHAADEDDDDDDDDDEFYVDNDKSPNPNVIDDIAPNFAGFQQHIMKLNPGLGNKYGYLVDRVAHQQTIRYKHLLNANVKHLNLGANCPCGSLCMALGGSANILDQKGDPKGLDPLSSKFDEEDNCTPAEGAISQESFPLDIPMPPAQYLPAEFECQLCFQKKKFQKPSDWTKHVHEDVQPFTCTWDNCREPKIFKRKADWVRHENEGHRHLEWWTCDVDDCRHTCHRRDNFLQHLVREHKFLEPKVKTKSAVKRAGGMDPTWQKVEQCHVETTARPQDEPCRFCGKVFPTWKKLTVHLAKHMEQISLPILRLVSARAKELAADTIISPVQGPPSRQSIPLSLNPSRPSTQIPAGQHMRHQREQQIRAQAQLGPDFTGHKDMNLQSLHQYTFPVMSSTQYQPQLYKQFENMGQNLRQPSLDVEQLSTKYHMDQRIQGLSSYQHDGYLSPNNNLMNKPDNSDIEPLPQLSMDALGIHDVGDIQISGQLGGNMAYDAMIDASSVNDSPFSGYESLSTYSHSSHLGASNKHQVQKQQTPYQQQGQ